MRRRMRSTTGPVLIGAVAALGLLVPAQAAAAPPAGAGVGGGSNPGTYENPLEPVVPGDGIVESCADPNILRGPEPGDTTWYLYCTTDPLGDEDVDAGGEPVFHRIPMLTSEDLVDWTYVGDAFPLDGGEIPDWIDPTSAFWAPEVAYSTATDTYYLFVTVTETTGAGGGSDTCRGDSAIGVAVGDSPTGPWTFSDEPVVAPRLRAGATGCDYLWTFDPDVLGDAVGAESVLYYGSYNGGIFADDITFTAAGASVDEDADGAVQVAVDNKYEGANVVFRDGYYYLFVSATNCCNGALTGYSVFVGRSTSPYGPFVDREGNSLLDVQTGGTPVISMNGNRWVGTGHNTVFQDAAGDWWTIYHAVDQQDPFFAFDPGFTKRPALLDPIDWIDGWPTVNGGQWASDERMRAPAGQEGEKSRYKTRLVATQEPGRLLFADEFSGTELDPAWSWVRGDAAEYEVADGVLSVQIQAAELFAEFNTASVLVRDAPKGDYVVETAVRVDIPDDPVCCYNYAQGGVLLYQDDDNFVKLTNTSIWNTRQTEWAKELFPVPEGWNRYGNTVVGPPSDSGEWTYLRIVVERLNGAERREAGGATHAYTAHTSQDGETWVRGGTWTHTLTDAQIALVAMGLQQPADFTAEFDYVRVSTLEERPAR